MAAAHKEGGISQSSQVLAKLTGIVQGPGQTLVLTYVVSPQSIAAGNAYHLTVPPRYVELGEMRQAMNLNGRFGESALAARDAYMQRLGRPEPRDSHADQLCRILDGMKADPGQATRESRGQRDVMPTVHLGVVGGSQWTHAIPAVTSRRGSTVLSRTIRTGLRMEPCRQRDHLPRRSWLAHDHGHRQCPQVHERRRFVFQMSRVLSIARLMERRCQGLFTGLIAAQRHGREEVAKRKKYRKEREEMRLELTAAQADIAKVASTLASVRQPYGEQQQEMHDECCSLYCT